MKKIREKWETKAQAENPSLNIDDLTWLSPEGIPIFPQYTKEDLQELENLDSIPGEQPFTRGPKATMYVGRPWTIRQYAGFSTAEESNIFYKNALKAGQQGVSVAFD